jgi:organic radical activating enzyme
MSVYCTYPWKQLFSDSYGVYMPCCMATVDHPHNGCWNSGKSDFPAPKVDDISPSEYYYSDYMKQLRSDMRGGKTTPLIEKVCANCIKEEKEGREGSRIPQLNEPLGRIIEVKLRLYGNVCNLSCYMCRIKDSSSRIKQTEKLMQIDPKFGEMLEYDKLTDEMKHGGVNYNVIEDIKKLAPKIKKIYIIGGEPFIMPRHYEVLNALIETGQAKNIVLKYHTNLTKLEWEGNNIFDYIKKFKGCEINWSLEALGERNNYIRFGSEWESNLKNYYKVKKYAQVWGNVCTSSLSILSLHKTIEWMKNEGLGYSFNNIQEPRPCRIDSLHPKIREKLLPMYKGTTIESSLSAEIENWEERWDELLRYLKALDKVNKTDYTKVFPELVM